jgi:hypothetical protein
MLVSIWSHLSLSAPMHGRVGIAAESKGTEWIGSVSQPEVDSGSLRSLHARWTLGRAGVSQIATHALAIRQLIGAFPAGIAIPSADRCSRRTRSPHRPGYRSSRWLRDRCGHGFIHPRVKGEHIADRNLERRCEAQGEREARAVFAAFEVADGLVVDTDRVGELLAAQAAVGADLFESVVDGSFVT